MFKFLLKKLTAREPLTELEATRIEAVNQDLNLDDPDEETNTKESFLKRLGRNLLFIQPVELLISPSNPRRRCLLLL